MFFKKEKWIKKLLKENRLQKERIYSHKKEFERLNRIIEEQCARIKLLEIQNSDIVKDSVENAVK